MNNRISIFTIITENGFGSTAEIELSNNKLTRFESAVFHQSLLESIAPYSIDGFLFPRVNIESSNIFSHENLMYCMKLYIFLTQYSCEFIK